MTDPDYHQRLEALFHELADLGQEARNDRLRQLGQSDPELASELTRLLAHDGESEEARVGTVLEPGARIGGYQLVRPLGEGGMGVVWLAEQTEPVRRQVALKLLPCYRLSESMAWRFDAERQALASLDHPNVASLFDSGTTPPGEPWFAMELIDGLPITTYCDRHRVPLAARFELFETLCEAVQHAHRRGLIHRDLKPSNVLVAKDPDHAAPRLRVIDFGIAKSVEVDGDFKTRAGDVIGTPEYMSPEQAGYDDSVVDTRTDVYALGVVLYELLVGELPISPQTLRQAGVDEMRRLIREQDAPKPSSRLTPDAEARTREIARCRSTEPDALLRRVRGELDWIVLKAIAKAKSERYETPRALAADLRRFMAGDPVEAGRPTWRYRASKWMRKHRQATAVIAGAAALIALSVVSITAALVRAQAAERAALREAAQERATREFLVELFEANDPYELDLSEAEVAPGDAASPRRITGEEILDRGARRLLDDRIEDPLTRARLQLTVGELYLQLARDDAAAELIDRALASLGDSASEAGVAPDLAMIEGVRAQLALGDLALVRGQHPQAIVHFRRAFEAAENDARVLRARALLGAAQALQVSARSSEAIAEAEAAVELARAARARGEPGADRTLEHSLAVLAAAQAASGDAARAIATYRALIARQLAVLGADHPRLSVSYRGLSHALEVAGDYAAGGEAAESALRISRAVLGDEHPAVAYDLANVAASHRMRGQYADAVGLLREAEKALRATRPESTALATTLGEIGMCLEELGRTEAAVAAHREALTIFERIHGEAHPDLGPALSRLSSALRAADRPEDALPLSRRAVELAEAAHPDGHWQVVVTLAELTQALIGARELEAAMTEADRMVAMARRLMGDDHVMHAAAQTIRSEALIELALEQNLDEPLEAAAEGIALARAIFEQQQGPQSPNLDHIALLEERLASARRELDERHELAAAAFRSE